MLLFIFLVCLFFGGKWWWKYKLLPSSLQSVLFIRWTTSFVSILLSSTWIWKFFYLFLVKFFNCLTVLCIYLMNFSHFHAVLSPNSPLTPPLASFLPRHPLLHSCLLFMCGPLIIRAPCLSVGGELLSRTRAIYLCLFSAAISVYVRFTLRSLTFSRMPRLLQATHGYLVNK